MICRKFFSPKNNFAYFFHIKLQPIENVGDHFDFHKNGIKFSTHCAIIQLSLPLISSSSTSSHFWMTLGDRLVYSYKDCQMWNAEDNYNRQFQKHSFWHTALIYHWWFMKAISFDISQAISYIKFWNELSKLLAWAKSDPVLFFPLLSTFYR